MSQGNRIILTPDRGVWVEGIIDTAEKPGTAVQLDLSQAAVGNRYHWVVYNRDADGDRPAGPLIILCEDLKRGQTTTDAYTAGDRAVGFIPFAACELNLLHLNISGTGDDVVIGGLLIPDDGTGKWLATTGTPEIEPAMALEAETDPTADRLLFCVWTGF